MKTARPAADVTDAYKCPVCGAENYPDEQDKKGGGQ